MSEYPGHTVLSGYWTYSTPGLSAVDTQCGYHKQAQINTVFGFCLATITQKRRNYPIIRESLQNFRAG